MRFRTLLAFLLTCLLLFSPKSALSSEDFQLTAPDGTLVSIIRDSYGVPHITGESESAVFFGQGFACAQDRLHQIDLFRLAGCGRLSELYGSDYLDADRLIRSLLYTEEERTQQFNSLDVSLRSMLTSFTSGINTYLDSMAVDPDSYLPMQFVGQNIESWEVTDLMAITQYMMRRFGQFGGQELARALEFQTYGREWFEEHRPVNDVAVPTTIPAGEGNQPVHKPVTRQARSATVHLNAEAINRYYEDDTRIDNQLREIGIPLKFGSFAAVVTGDKSASGNVMLLGAPQMDHIAKDNVSIVNEVELTCPTFHVGGMTVAGIPGVLIGHNDNLAWTLTSGFSDNTDVYIETTSDDTCTKYLYNGEWIDFERIDEVILTTDESIAFTHYRTVHGPVFFADLDNRQAFSARMSFWNKEVETLGSLYTFWQSETLEEFEVGASKIPISFNMFYAGKDQIVKHWHVGLYNDRTDAVDPRLPHIGDGSEEWGGTIPFSELPSVENPTQGYLANWNNKPAKWWNNGDNVPWAYIRIDDFDVTEDYYRQTDRVKLMIEYIEAIATITFEELKDIPQQINSNGTYQQAIVLSEQEIIDENVLPPGQSGFINTKGEPSPHFDDQWEIHTSWQFKDMEFGTPALKPHFEETIAIPTIMLHQNNPNPFNSMTMISFSIQKEEKTKLVVYNILGERIRVLVNEKLPPGNHSVSWNAGKVPSGIYFYRLIAGSYELTRKLMIIK